MQRNNNLSCNYVYKYFLIEGIKIKKKKKNRNQRIVTISKRAKSLELEILDFNNKLKN